jgi:hypothetical protein
MHAVVRLPQAAKVPGYWIASLLLVVLPVIPAHADFGKVAVRVLDDETGKPIPARLAIKTSDGRYHLDRLATSTEKWPNVEAHATFMDGEETYELPAGVTSISAAHGMEYEVATKTIEAKPNQLIQVELRLKRFVNMRKAGWVAGDLHMHMIHGENQRKTSYEDVALTCAASGLDFVAVGQEYIDAGSLTLEGYKQKCRQVSTDAFTMFLGGERPKNLLGHQVILGCDDPFVISEDPPYFKSADAIHKQGGIAVYVHPLRYYPGKNYGGEWLDFPGNNLARELIFDAYAGPSFDGLSVLSDEPGNAAAHQLWFNLLNRGLFVPAFADSDACFDRPVFGLKAPGFWNTYFHIGSEVKVTQEVLAEAVRQGRTMATTGPLLQFQIDQELSGATIPLDGKTREVVIESHYPQHAMSLEQTDPATKQPVGISRIELIRNGKIVYTWRPNSTHIKVSHRVTETEPCWFAVRAYGTDDRWQVAIASPIYFAKEKVTAKREPLSSLVRGRIYDFVTGEDRKADVEIRQHDKVIETFSATGSFKAKVPIDAEIVVRGDKDRPIRKNLLLDYGPIHRFLWNLTSADMAKDETLDRMEFLARSIDLEFPLGHRLAGCYVAHDLTQATALGNIKVASGPPAGKEGSVAVAAILTDVEQIAPGDTMNVAAVFRDEGGATLCGPYVVEARGYDPSRPTGFGALKKFGSFERNWDTATNLGDGYKLVVGQIEVPKWVTAGPTGYIDLAVRARRGNGDAAFVGVAIPLGPTQRALTLSSSWPTMPLSWPDRAYGIGPLKICNRVGRKTQSLGDYRELRLTVTVAGEELDLLPSRDGRGCADADDAMYREHFLDQVLNEETNYAKPEPIREQPKTD